MKIEQPVNTIHHHYSTQSESQPVYVRLDCRGKTLSIGTAGEVGGWPAEVYHRLVRRWRVPCTGLTAAGGKALLEEVRPLAEDLLGEYEEDIDPGSGRPRGRLTERGEEMEREVQDLVEDWPDRHLHHCVVECRAADWYEPVHDELLGRLAAGESLADLRSEIEDENTNPNGGALVLLDIDGYLEELEQASEKEV